MNPVVKKLRLAMRLCANRNDCLRCPYRDAPDCSTAMINDAINEIERLDNTNNEEMQENGS